MPRLIFKFKDKLIGEFSIAENKKLTIGRLKTNDVVIDNLAVSGNHAKIFHHEKGFVLTDLKSKNGTFVNQKRVKAYLLKHKDIITIGKHILIYDNLRAVKSEAGSATTANSPQSLEWISSDKTMFMDTAQHKKMLGKKVPKPDKKTAVAVVKYLSGGTGELDLNKSVITIGKDTDSDIVISGNFSFFMGKTAATIAKTVNNYRLRYVGGFPKPKVNRNIIKNYIILHDGDIIEIGPVKLQFYIAPPVKDAFANTGFSQ